MDLSIDPIDGDAQRRPRTRWQSGSKRTPQRSAPASVGEHDVVGVLVDGERS